MGRNLWNFGQGQMRADCLFSWHSSHERHNEVVMFHVSLIFGVFTASRTYDRPPVECGIPLGVIPRRDTIEQKAPSTNAAAHLPTGALLHSRVGRADERITGQCVKLSPIYRPRIQRVAYVCNGRAQHLVSNQLLTFIVALASHSSRKLHFKEFSKARSDKPVRFAQGRSLMCSHASTERACFWQLDAARDEVLAELDIKLYNKLRACGVGPGKDECYFEITVGPNNIEIPDDVFVHAWSCFFEALQKAESS
eukprot:6202921-Pleurochrysis_carterae.AAC.1